VGEGDDGFGCWQDRCDDVMSCSASRQRKIDCQDWYSPESTVHNYTRRRRTVLISITIQCWHSHQSLDKTQLASCMQGCNFLIHKRSYSTRYLSHQDRVDWTAY